ncbi:unnamed protein product [Phytomonas sp. Hart1]|nr:unnamed protein product [Phytomonas sp. Hart1]|eukprot:CCW70083.1 unnamed protein product [Phytomonas sp. isolate Hart1]
MSTTFTAEQLAHFNGEGDTPIYISLKGIIYDCSTGEIFYGENKPYHSFAGKEITRCLAKMLVSSTEANSGWSNLSEKHILTLNTWVEKYESKYPIVGTFQPDPDFESRGKKFDP